MEQFESICVVVAVVGADTGFFCVHYSSSVSVAHAVHPINGNVTYFHWAQHKCNVACDISILVLSRVRAPALEVHSVETNKLHVAARTQLQLARAHKKSFALGIRSAEFWFGIKENWMRFEGFAANWSKQMMCQCSFYMIFRLKLVGRVVCVCMACTGTLTHTFAERYTSANSMQWTNVAMGKSRITLQFAQWWII